ncbi:MAG: glycosyltransferase [Alphaproteobacteria bacterium]
MNNLGLRAPGRSRGDWGKAARRIGEWFQGAVRKEEKLWVVSPVHIPLHQWSMIQALNRWNLPRFLRREMRFLGLKKPILWSFLPLGVDLIGDLDESLVVYHCVDDYAANPGVAAGQLREMEAQLLAKADLVLTTNPVLYEERRDRARRAVYVGNVADTSHFEHFASRTIPPRLASLPRPILGYQGNISEYKTDLPLLTKLAQAMTEASVVLIGPVGWGDPTTDVSALTALPNVHLPGRVSFAELPAYVSAFDVGLLPLRINESTRRSFPMKFYEYMAAGKPIVATALPAFEPYRDRPQLCRLAENTDEFITAVREVLAEEVDHTAERIAEARANSWDVRVPQIGKIVTELLREKEGA